MTLNPKDLTYITVSELYSHTLTELRDMAAFFGVDSPTKRSKKELVEMIYRAKCGDSTVFHKEGLRGRPNSPPKGKYYINWDKVPELHRKSNGDNLYSGVFKASDNNVNKNKVDKSIDLEKDVDINSQLGEEEFCGFLNIITDTYGFVRMDKSVMSDDDVYINIKTIREYSLREGDLISCVVKKYPKGKKKVVIKVITINGLHVTACGNRPSFDSLVPIFPHEKYSLENFLGDSNISSRAIDLICPIGKGQRALVVAPPKAGKTTLIKNIANAIVRNYPNSLLFMLLIDERPEEVTDMKMSVDAEVLSSTFDESANNHIRIAETALNRAKREVECGRDVVIIMDSLTRLARAYNAVTESTGKTMTGGLSAQSLNLAKKFFGAGRCIQNGGSLTIIATALVDTGSKMDDIIYEEFKGTGNMELVLSRKLADHRIFPAIDISKSSTRREDLLLSNDEIKAISQIRRFTLKNELEATTEFFDLIDNTKSNSELCGKVNSKKIKLN